MERESAELTDAVLDAIEQLRMLLDQELSAVLAARLLVRHDAQDDITGRRVLCRSHSEKGVDHHGDASLHVQGSAAPHESIDDVAAHRVAGPLLAGCRDNVNVTLHQEWGCLAPTRNPGHEIRPRRILGENQRLDSGCRQKLVDVSNGFALIAWWIGRVKANQRLQHFDRRDLRHHNSSEETAAKASAVALGAISPGPFASGEIWLTSVRSEFRSEAA